MLFCRTIVSGEFKEDFTLKEGGQLAEIIGDSELDQVSVLDTGPLGPLGPTDPTEDQWVMADMQGTVKAATDIPRTQAFAFFGGNVMSFDSFKKNYPLGAEHWLPIHKNADGMVFMNLKAAMPVKSLYKTINGHNWIFLQTYSFW